MIGWHLHSDICFGGFWSWALHPLWSWQSFKLKDKCVFLQLSFTFYSRGNSVLNSPSINLFETICPTSVTAIKIAFSDDFPELPRSKPQSFIQKIFFDVLLGVSNYILNTYLAFCSRTALKTRPVTFHLTLVSITTNPRQLLIHV